MTVTERLLRVFRVDRQIDGLRSRLRAAERFLAQQNHQIEQIEQRRASLESQLRQLQAAQLEAEGESAQIEEHIEVLRERMNTAKTNKEYKAVLAEVNTFKAKKDELDTRSLEMLEKIEQIKQQQAELVAQAEERAKVREVAESDREARAEEIREKLAELEAARAELVREVPPKALTVYAELVERLDEDAMAQIEIADKKRHEFHCGSCMMLLPVETMSGLLSHGRLTQCPSCGCILYVEESDREIMTSTKR